MTGSAKIVFYHCPRTRSSIVHWMLEELGVPYERQLLNLRQSEHKAPDYLAVNPMGKVPAITHDGVPVTEAAAICCHLADAFPEAGLNVPVGDPQRGAYLKWMFFYPGALEPALLDQMMDRVHDSEGPVPYGNFDTLMTVVADAVAPGPYLLGDRFTAADVLIGSGLRWGTMMGKLPERPEFTAYLARLHERPALQRADTRDAELAEKMAG